MKKFICFLTAFVLASSALVFGEVDEKIFTDPVANTYTGRSDGSLLIQNLDFSDLPASHWAKESVIRSGSLNLVKGFDNNYSPDLAVTNQEALAFVIRLMNLESQAVDEAVRIRNNFSENETTRSLWSIGYISLARARGIITAAEYSSLTAADTELEFMQNDPANIFRTAPATRERVAYWIALALNSIVPGIINLNTDIQKALTFSDWEDIGIDYLKAVEAISRANIMLGDDNGRFRPKASLTRAEMAQVLRNMDSIYYIINAIEKKTGTVGGVRDNQLTLTGSAAVWRNFYIRGADGTVDVLMYMLAESNPALETRQMDTVVFKNGRISGLAALTEGDQIEYLVDAITNEVLYVQVLREGIQESFVEGRLYEIDTASGTITLQDDAKKTRIYTMASGLFAADYVVIDQARTPLSNLPIGSRLRLRLLGRVVESISFLGSPVIVTELRGIVVENNTDFGYLTVYDNSGQLVTKNYYADSIKVEKQQYYDLDDEIGYIDEMFPNFKYDPRDTFIEDIEPGDIVFMRFMPDDPDVISTISASTNYVAKYGKIRQITRGEGVSRFLVEYENKQTTWFDVADNIFVSKLGKPASHNAVVAGDWARFLVNQAIIQPGYIIESVKEITVEGGEHFISTIIKGQMAGIEPIQKKLMIQNAQTLSKTGWSNYQNIQQISIASNDIEYYYNNQRISLDYAERFLKRSDGEVYVALENSASGERAKMITFRNGRDELLSPDTVITSDGTGSFAVLSNPSDILTDTGTIVRRYGRLVDSNNILPSDYTVVSLNGGSTAAVVDIVEAPDTSGVSVARGRILSVDQGQSFKVQSMSVLSGTDWVYTPIQREFTIDYNTRLLYTDGIAADINQFMDYTENSAIDKVYNIVYDGSKATWIVESPYSKFAVRGVVYEASGNPVTVVRIKNAEYFDSATGKWNPVSLTNATMEITVPINSIVVKNNSVVRGSNIVAGDTIRVLTDSLPQRITSGSSVTGYMVFVDK